MKNCLNCESFTYWDGDWCCTLKMKLLSRINEKTNKTINPENCTKDRSDCGYWREETWEPALKFNKELWEEYL